MFNFGLFDRSNLKFVLWKKKLTPAQQNFVVVGCVVGCAVGCVVNKLPSGGSLLRRRNKVHLAS